MFMGEYQHTIDLKGRIIVPSKFREGLGENFVVTLGLDGCLFLYPMEEWETFVTELNKLPGNLEGRQLKRYFLANASEGTIDKQGRLLVPGNLREHASLQKEIVLIGVLNKVEVWDKEQWEKNSYEDVNMIAEHMASFGLSF